jgi:hypothetical protein
VTVGSYVFCTLTAGSSDKSLFCGLFLPLPSRVIQPAGEPTPSTRAPASASSRSSITWSQDAHQSGSAAACMYRYCRSKRGGVPSPATCSTSLLTGQPEVPSGTERRPERARDQRRISADAETLHICEQGNAEPTKNAMAVKRSSFFRRSDPWWLALTPKGSSFAGRSSGRVLDLLIVPPGAQGVSDRRPDQNRSRFC